MKKLTHIKLETHFRITAATSKGFKIAFENADKSKILAWQFEALKRYKTIGHAEKVGLTFIICTL